MTDIELYRNLVDLSDSKNIYVFFSFTCNKKFTKILKVFRSYMLTGEQNLNLNQVFVLRSKFLTKAYPQLAGLFYSKYALFTCFFFYSSSKNYKFC